MPPASLTAIDPSTTGETVPDHDLSTAPGVTGDAFDAVLLASAQLIDARTTGELLEAVADWGGAATGLRVSVHLTTELCDGIDDPHAYDGELVRMMESIGPDEVRQWDGLAVAGFFVNARHGGWVVGRGAAVTDGYVDQLRALARPAGRGLERLQANEACTGWSRN